MVKTTGTVLFWPGNALGATLAMHWRGRWKAGVPLFIAFAFLYFLSDCIATILAYGPSEFLRNILYCAMDLLYIPLYFLFMRFVLRYRSYLQPYRRTAIIVLPVILSVFIHGIIAGTMLNMILYGDFSGFRVIKWTNEQLTTCLIVTMMAIGCFYPGWRARSKALEFKSILTIAFLAAIQVALSFSQWLSITSIAIIPCLIAISRLGFLWSILVTGGFMTFSSITQAYFYTSALPSLPPALFFPELFAHRMNTAMVAVFSIFMGDLVSQRNRLLKSAQQRAETDRLTGLHNRHYVLRTFERAAVRTSIGLVIIDIDNFKQINDRYGHHVGDEVLTAVSAKIRKLVRHKTDIAARWGGEEFLLILSDISPADLKSVCNRLVEDIGSKPLELDIGPFPVTISAGATHLVNLLSHDFAQALSSADMLLYQAKRSGKNRVIFSI